MLSKKLLTIFLVVLTLSLALFIYLASNSSPKLRAIPVSHYRLADIQDAITRYPKLRQEKSSDPVRGGVVSHHLLASDEIARYFQNLSKYSYKRVVVIGPNHGELGINHLVTGNWSWETPYGQVKADTELVSKLATSGVLAIDNTVLSKDHSIEVIMPFIKLYLPKSSVIPIMVSYKTTPAQIERLVEGLRSYQSKDTLFLVSSDFSHFLVQKTASKKDEESLSLIKQFQIERISHLGNDHIDSGTSIAILLRLMQDSKTTRLEEFGHTDASTIAKTPTTPTTTYFFLNYYAENSGK